MNLKNHSKRVLLKCISDIHILHFPNLKLVYIEYILFIEG